MNSNPPARAVLVTGASTGIGAACAEHLDRQGFKVFAGVRKESDADRLKQVSEGRIVPAVFDVTDADAITRATAAITQALNGAGLYGLVNNAGVAVAGPLEFLPMDALRRQLEINVLGQIAVTQAFLPLIRQAKGRIINMGSISGKVATPFMGPYSASKHALEALTDALRLELRPWGIHVSIVEPGAIATPIWDKSSATAATMVTTLPPQAHQLYGKALGAIVKFVAKLAKGAIPPEFVARVVAHALTANRPKTRYLVGKDAKIQALIWRILPDTLADALLIKAMGLSSSTSA